MRKILTENFFEQNALKVTKDLLGKFLCRKNSGETICLMITEVEAYDGFNDKASHAHHGKTKRNEPMFGDAGRWYVYFTYGMHWMLNIVTGPKDYPAAVLIRGLSKMQRFPRHAYPPAGGLLCSRRRVAQGLGKRSFSKSINLDGPGKLTKFLKIDKRFNDKKAVPKTGLWIEDRGIKIKSLQIRRAPRVGVAYAGKWAKKPYRFLLK